MNCMKKLFAVAVCVSAQNAVALEKALLTAGKAGVGQFTGSVAAGVAAKFGTDYLVSWAGSSYYETEDLFKKETDGSFNKSDAKSKAAREKVLGLSNFLSGVGLVLMADLSQRYGGLSVDKLSLLGAFLVQQAVDQDGFGFNKVTAPNAFSSALGLTLALVARGVIVNK